MKRNIKGFIQINKTDLVGMYESIQHYVNVFGKYFEHIGNCILNFSLTGYSNIILCYTKIQKIIGCEICTPGRIITIDDEWVFGPADPIWEHIHINMEIPKFIRIEIGDYEKRLCGNSIIISLKGNGYNRVVGEFCPVKKILITSDWTHDVGNLGFVTTLFNRMEEEGLLSVRAFEKRKYSIMLGTDPEFEYIDKYTDEIINCKEAGIRDRMPIVPGGEGRIGHDGAGAQRELRPEPANTPEGLIANIDKLINAALDEKWSLRGERWTLGGHIHIGGVEESSEFTKLLDHYLGPLCVLNSRIREESCYGKPGNSDAMRKQPHGIEYRVPPVGWLASRELARVTLKIVKLAAEKHYNGNDIELTDSIGNDLVSLGLTETEMKTFFMEIHKHKSDGLPNDLKVAWGYKAFPKFMIDFRGIWNEEIKNYLNDTINQMAITEQLVGNVVFYGLSKERGNVFSLAVSLRGIEIPETYGIIPPVKENKNHIGIPNSIRTNMFEAVTHINVIKDIVKRTINLPMERSIKKQVVGVQFNEYSYGESWQPRL